MVLFEVFCFVNCGESFGIIFCTLFDNNGLSVNFASVANSLFLSMTGCHLIYFKFSYGRILSPTMPAFLRGFNYISVLKWGTGAPCYLFSLLTLGAVLTVSLQKVKFHCTTSQLLGDGTCPVTTGEEVLGLYNLNVNTLTYSFGMLACLIIYRLIAYGLLKLKLTSWNLRKV